MQVGRGAVLHPWAGGAGCELPLHVFMLERKWLQNPNCINLLCRRREEVKEEPQQFSSFVYPQPGLSCCGLRAGIKTDESKYNIFVKFKSVCFNFWHSPPSLQHPQQRARHPQLCKPHHPHRLFFQSIKGLNFCLLAKCEQQQQEQVNLGGITKTYNVFPD